MIHLNTHSEFDRVRGGMSIQELVDQAVANKATACALTDPGHLMGMFGFVNKAREAGIKPIVGIEVYVNSKWNTITPDLEQDKLGATFYPLTLLAKDNRGLKELIALSSSSWIHNLVPHDKMPVPRVCFQDLATLKHVICLSGNHYSLPRRALFHNQPKLLMAWMSELQAIFQDNFFVQLPAPHNAESVRVIKALSRFGKAVFAPLVLYAQPEHRELHKQKMACIMNTKLYYEPADELGIELDLGKRHIELHSPCHMWTEQEIRTLCFENQLPHEYLDNTQLIADMCEDDYFHDVYNKYPVLNLDKPSWMELKILAQNLLVEKLGKFPSEEYKNRLDYELAVIKKMGYSDYMLIVYDYLEGVKKQNIIVGPGRGSAAGSLVAYALGITALDPIQYGLIFERWLNIGRSATPLIFDPDIKKKLRMKYATTRN